MGRSDRSSISSNFSPSFSKVSSMFVGSLHLYLRFGFLRWTLHERVVHGGEILHEVLRDRVEKILAPHLHGDLP